MKKSMLSLLISVITLGMVACTPTKEPLTAPTPVTVQLAWTHQSQFAGLYAADQLGYYAEEGLAVSFIEGGASYDKLAPVLDGTAQFGVGGADEIILARSQQKPLIAIATIFRRNPVIFVSLVENNITRPQDFVGKTIRASANVIPTLKAMMAKLGFSSDQYTAVDAPSDIQMFASGEMPVWGIFINSFAVTLIDAGYKLNIVYPDDYGVHFYADCLFTTDQVIESEPELTLRFLRASLKGWTYAIENPQEMAALVQKYNPDADLIVEDHRMLATIPLVNTGEDHIGWMDAQVWSGMQQTMREQGLLTQSFDITRTYTLQFIEEIYR